MVSIATGLLRSCRTRDETKLKRAASWQLLFNLVKLLFRRMR